MARGSVRAPSQHAYKGALGRTQTAHVHVTGPRGEMTVATVYTTIDAVADPELADRLHETDAAKALNVARFDGAEPVRLAVPVVYHDPAAEVFALVLGDAHRHRELEERIAVYQRLLADGATIPRYVKDLAVVWGGAGLRSYLEERAHQTLEQDRARVDQEKRGRELERTRLELDVQKAELAKQRAEIDHQKSELARDRAELDRLRSEARHRAIAAAQKIADRPDEATVISTAPSAGPREDLETRPISKQELADIVATTPPSRAAQAKVNGRAAELPGEDFDADLETGVVDALVIESAAALPPVQVDESVPFERGDDGVEIDDETTGTTQPPTPIPPGSDPLTTDCHDLANGAADSWLADAVKQGGPSWKVEDKTVRLALVTGEGVARSLGGQGSAIDVRVILRRAPTYPVVALVLGSPAALRTPHPNQLAIVLLDIANEPDRSVLAALAKRFELAVDIVVRGKRLRRVRLTAPLSDNVAYIVRAAEDHLRGVRAEDEPSLARARELVLSPGYDLLGFEQPDTAEFRDDRLAQLGTAQQLRRAVAMARRFARPSREDYLVCTRGFPLVRWRQLRRAVVEKAVEWGIWMGPELAQVAVSEGLARSRRDLVVRLDRGFEALKKHPAAFDIDEEAADDNAKALAEEARALGVDEGGGLGRRRGGGGREAETARPSREAEELAKTRNGAIASDEASVVSGSIGGTPPSGIVRPKATIEELMAQLDDKATRLSAALELCDRADGRAAAKVVASVQKMSRAEAVRVLGMAVKFGEAAKQPLLDGLGNSKSFLRHGCALALALLRTEDGTQAVIDLLLSEPTEIWREVARAIGQVGQTALLPLAATYGRLGERANPSTAERVAWAMAHIAVRGGKAAVEAMARGESVVAPVARQALQLHGSAANDHVRLRPGADGSQPGRDVTVNRAFSKRFFEALEAGIPDAGQAGLVDLEASGPMEMLDEADLIDDDEEAELDESDLIQS